MRSERGLRVRLLLASLFLLDGAVLRASTVVERTLAFVNKKPILLSDVLLTKTLLQLDLDQAIERTIDETLMYDEAARLLGGAPREEEIAGAVAVLKEKAGPSFSDAALVRKATAQIAIAKYIDLRLRPLVRVEETDVRRTYDEKIAGDPLAPAFALVAPSIREALERQSLDLRIEEWVTSLRRREAVRRPKAAAHASP